VECALQGDRMWQFAVGLYLVRLNDGQLRLAAVFGLTCSGLILLLGGLIGSWVDRSSRLTGTMIRAGFGVGLGLMFVLGSYSAAWWADWKLGGSQQSTYWYDDSGWVWGWVRVNVRVRVLFCCLVGSLEAGWIAAVDLLVR